MVTEELSAIYLPKTFGVSPEKILETYYTNADIALIEGWISGPFQKIEVWRKAIGRSPLFTGIQIVKAVVAEDPLENINLPVFQRSDVDSLADFLLTLI